MPPETGTLPDAVVLSPKTALGNWTQVENQFKRATRVHWADTNEGAPVVDLIPNPKRFLVGEIAGFKLAMDCGEPGMGIHKAQ
jgi:hypothetical protein